MRFTHALLVVSASLSVVASVFSNTHPWVIVSLNQDRQLAVYQLNEDTATLSLLAKTATRGRPASMGLAPDGRHVYVSMRDSGAVAAFRLESDASLTALGEGHVGADPAYINVHPNGKYVVSAYYAAGKVAVHGILEEGSITPEPVQVIETDERAHAAVWAPDARHVFIPHTRPNAIFQFAFDPQSGLLSPNEPAKLEREAGSGPRHLWFHPQASVAYGSDEQGLSITSYHYDPQRGTLTKALTVSSVPNEFNERGSTSDIEVHPSGKFVYIANRGHNSIASFAIDAADPTKLTLAGHAATEAVPRSFNISPDGRFLVAAGQRSGKVAVFRIGDDGALGRTSTLEAGNAPWWVQFVSKPPGESVSSDWPHPRGPQLNGKTAPNAAPLNSLPDNPRVVWRLPATDGFAAPIITRGRVIYGDYQKRQEVFHAVSLADGKQLWEDVLGEPHKDGFGTGPRCAPVSDGEIVLTQSCKAELHCLDAATGKLLWEKNYQKDFGAPYAGETGNTLGGARHGYNASPCINGDHVITLAGGPGAGVVCLNKKSGEVIWQSQDDQAAYSPPLVATVAGVEQVIAFTVNGVVGLRRSNGELLWRVPLTTDYGRHIAAPVVFDDLVIVGSHQVGLIATRILNQDGMIRTEEAWKHGKEKGPNISSPILMGGHLYLLAGTQTLCLDARTGEQKWAQDGMVISPERGAFGAFIGIGENMLMLTDLGELILFKANPNQYEELGRTQVCGKNWCHPAYADGKLIVRDAKRLYCIDLMDSD